MGHSSLKIDFELPDRLQSKAGQMPAHQILMTRHGRKQLTPCEGEIEGSLEEAYSYKCASQRDKWVTSAATDVPAISINVGVPVSIAV